ncbi:hypothetical protein DSM100685_1351 [Bifidobacterium avesanii]|nr:hypothetical protein DSM100685_1351 [Bifidobacterium avesanii]
MLTAIHGSDELAQIPYDQPAGPVGATVSSGAAGTGAAESVRGSGGCFPGHGRSPGRCGEGARPDVWRALLRESRAFAGAVLREAGMRVAMVAVLFGMLAAGIGLADQAFGATRDAGAAGTVLPASWESDMRAMVPDSTLRALMTAEVRREFPGANLSAKTTAQVLASIRGDGKTSDKGWPAWDLGKAYAGSGLPPIRLLNGVQYLSGVYEVNARGLGLEVLAMPEVGVETKIPNLNIVGNVFHILPSKLYEKNFSTTRNAIINPNQEYYHHTGVTYVRSGAGQPKTIRVEAGILQLTDDAAAVKAVRDGGGELPVKPILDRTEFGGEDLSFNTTTGATVSKDAAAWTVTGFGHDAKDGEVMNMAQYTYAVRHTDRNGALDAVSLSYFYGLRVDFLSTVRHTASATVLGDFSFRKTSASNPEQGLAGAVYVLRDAQGRYVRGANNAAIYDDAGALDTADRADADGVLRLTTGGDGTFTARNLPASPEGVRYELVEVAAPDGYETASAPVPVTVKSSANAVSAGTDGGEGDSATVTKDEVTAVADRWTDASTTPAPTEDFGIDYVHSGEAMTMRAHDGSEAATLRRAADYGGADVFIRNGGSPVSLHVDGAGNAWKPLVSRSTVVAGNRADAATVHAGEGLAAVDAAQRQINDVIASSGMTRDDDYYTVNTTVVYHDDASLELNRYTDGRHEQTDRARPIDVTVQARKHFTGRDGDLPIEAGRFTLSMEPQDGAPAPADGTSSPVDADGLAQWRLPAITWDVYRKAKDRDGVATFRYAVSETRGDDPNVEYDRTVHQVEIRVTERENADGSGVTHGLNATVLVNGREAASGTGAQGTITVGGDAIAFTNHDRPGGELPMTGGIGVVLPVTAGGSLLLAGTVALSIATGKTVRRSAGKRH